MSKSGKTKKAKIVLVDAATIAKQREEEQRKIEEEKYRRENAERLERERIELEEKQRRLDEAKRRIKAKVSTALSHAAAARLSAQHMAERKERREKANRDRIMANRKVTVVNPNQMPRRERDTRLAIPGQSFRMLSEDAWVPLVISASDTGGQSVEQIKERLLLKPKRG